MSLKASLVLIAFSSFLAPLYADSVYLLESESPYTLKTLELEESLLVDIETGAIPTSIMKPQIGFGLFDWLMLHTNTTLALFLEAPEFRIAEVEFAIRAAILPMSHGELSLFGYARVHGTLGTTYAVGYRGNLDLVDTVISQHGDPGIDLIGGFAGEVAFDFFPHGFSFLFSMDYARTFLRNSIPRFNTEGHKNRVFLNLVPTYSLGLDSAEGATLDFAAQNRLTLWMERGFMYDLLLQSTVPIGDKLSVTAGVSVPIVGGQVVKVFLTGRYSHRLTIRDEIRVNVEGLHFPPNSAVLFGPENESSGENERIINKLYQDLLRYAEYSIIVEGHTSFVYWDDPVKGPAEQRSVLIPLSEARAQSVMEALVDRGLERSRMKAVGKGGSEPIVPFSNKDEQWRNRRVEVLLYRSL